MKQVVFLLVVGFGWLALLGASSAAHANSGYMVGICDGCVEAVRQQKAIEVSELNPGRVYIIDRWSLQIHPLQVLVQSEPGSIQVSVSEIDGLSEEISLIESALDSYAYLRSSQSINAPDLPFPNPHHPNVPTSGFDIPGNPTAQYLLTDAVGKYIANNLPGGIKTGATPVRSIPLGDDLRAAITVAFPDGTSYQVIHSHTTIDSTTGELQFHYEIVAGSGLDADGALIPDSADDVSPGFQRGTGDAESWGELLERIGFRSTGSEWRHGSGGGCLSCTWEERPDDGTLRCVRC